MLRLFLLGFAIAGVLPLRAATAGKPVRDESAKTDSSKVDSLRGSPSPDYLLAPQDVIRVKIYQEPDLTSELRISAEGLIELPLIGRIDLKGKTIRQAEETIRKLYDADYLVDPQVNLSIMEYAPRTVEVFGAVNTPGVVLFPKEKVLTLTEAISTAGSTNRLANRKAVTLKRKMPDGSTKSFTINLDDLIRGDSEAQNVPLEPGDVITVPERIL
jgi:polysaccharide export outer membrane protein